MNPSDLVMGLKGKDRSQVLQGILEAPMFASLSFRRRLVDWLLQLVKSLEGIRSQTYVGAFFLLLWSTTTSWQPRSELDRMMQHGFLM